MISKLIPNEQFSTNFILTYHSKGIEQIKAKLKDIQFENVLYALISTLS